MHPTPTDDRPVLLTGATGFIGREILRRLLAERRRVVALVRAESDADAARRFETAAEAAGGARLQAVAGDTAEPQLGLPPAEYERLRGRIGMIIHVAGCTRFEPGAGREPFRSNVDGVRELIALAERSGAPVHHFSTAFVCGDRTGPLAERDEAHGAPRNAYEASKQWGERLLAEARAAGRLAGLTVYRPTITIADAGAPAAHCGRGLQLFLRNLRRVAGRRAGSGRVRRLPIRMEAHPEDPVHLVPVGWVADLFAAILRRPALHGGVWNLALPRPPSAAEFVAAIEEHLGIRLAGFTGRAEPRRESAMNAAEIEFYRLCRPLRPYISQQMRFGCERLAAAPGLERWAGAAFAPEMWPALFGTGEAARPAAPAPDAADAECAEYFERWMPGRVAGSRVAQVSSLCLTVGFRIAGGGAWTCGFQDGMLTQVRRGVDTGAVRAGFDVGRTAFLDIVSGRVEPQAAFFRGEAEIFGDVEAGLKFAMILREFVEEYPWRGALLPPAA